MAAIAGTSMGAVAAGGEGLPIGTIVGGWEACGESRDLLGECSGFRPYERLHDPGGADCSPSSLPSKFASGTGGNNLSLNPGDTATQNFTFTGCQ